MGVRVKAVNFKGGVKPISLFRYFDDGLRKRLPKLVAEEYKEALINNIESNRFGFSLSESWLSRKKALGADARPFIMFRHYLEAISVIQSDGHATVGFKKSDMHPRAKVTTGSLATKLEFGDPTAGIPARPLWRNTADNLMSTKGDKITALVKHELSLKGYKL